MRFSGSLLRDARIAAGWTQSGLARELDVADLTVWRWEHDQAEPGANALPPLAAAVRVDIADLFTVTEEVPA